MSAINLPLFEKLRRRPIVEDSQLSTDWSELMVISGFCRDSIRLSQPSFPRPDAFPPHNSSPKSAGDGGALKRVAETRAVKRPARWQTLRSSAGIWRGDLSQRTVCKSQFVCGKRLSERAEANIIAEMWLKQAVGHDQKLSESSEDSSETAEVRCQRKQIKQVMEPSETRPWINGPW